MAVSMRGLFAMAPPSNPVRWFALTTTGSSPLRFLTISFYGQGVLRRAMCRAGMCGWPLSGERRADWRLLTAVAPTVLMGVVADPFAVFAWGFAACVLVATLGMAPEWTARAQAAPTPLRAIWGDGTARRLLLLALVNAMPLAVSSTLFLFFVESRLAAPGFEGPLLVLFFLAAAVSAPIWSAIAQRQGVRPTLIFAMVAAILSFGMTLTLGPGDAPAFAVICIVSGAAIGADLTLMPALFARRMEEVAPNGGQGFGLWSLVNKLTLAIAAAVLLPALDVAGFVSGGENEGAALQVLTLLYGGLPILLKLGAIAMLLRLTLPEARAVSGV